MTIKKITDKELEILEQEFKKKLQKGLDDKKKYQELEKKYPWFVKSMRREKRNKNLREKSPYFLDLVYTTDAFFLEIVDEGIKVIVPIEGDNTRFYRMHTEKGFVFHETKPEIAQKTLMKQYKDYDVLYINDSFEISAKPDKDFGVVAYVCVPKNDKKYKKSKRDRLAFIKKVLKNYCWQTNDWDLWVVNRFDFKNKIDFYSLSYSDNQNTFSAEDEKWFKKCKTKYGITQNEINIAKSIIKVHKYKFSDFVFTPKSKTSLNIDIWSGLEN